MDQSTMINELRSLQVYFLNGYEKATRLIEQLESVNSPAPSGDDLNSKAHIISMIDKRSSKILEKAQ